jgi:hypothetical protein
MKTFCLFIGSLLISFAGFAQDSIPGQPVRIDTVVVEKVRVDTVFVETPAASEQPQEQVTKETPPNIESRNNKVYYGGYTNFSFGKYSVIGGDVLIAYKLFPKFSIGGKFSYEYFKNKNYSPTREGSNWGVGAFTRLRILRRWYAHLEFSEMSYKLYDETGDNSNRQWISFLLVGGGFSQPIAKNVSINAEILWDVLQNDDSPYKTVEPMVNIGIGVGF